MPTPAQHHQHFPFYAAGIAYCGCKEHFGLTPVQADAIVIAVVVGMVLTVLSMALGSWLYSVSTLAVTR
jgi:hypothetical protein